MVESLSKIFDIIQRSAIYAAAFFIASIAALWGYEHDQFPKEAQGFFAQYYGYFLLAAILSGVLLLLLLPGVIFRCIRRFLSWRSEEEFLQHGMAPKCFRRIKKLPQSELFVLLCFAETRISPLRLPRWPEVDSLVARNILDMHSNSQYSVESDYWRALMIYRADLLDRFDKIIQERGQDKKEIYRLNLFP